MKIITAIKQAYKSLVKRDDTAYPQSQSKYSGKPTDHTRLSTYGLCANAPKDCHVFLICSQGMESTKFGIENDFIRRLKGLKEGECALYNTLTESMVLLDADGNVNITAPIIKINGDVEIVGSSILHNGKEVGETHGHTQANDSNGDTEQPISGVT